jgi:hypothetical protein
VKFTSKLLAALLLFAPMSMDAGALAQTPVLIEEAPAKESKDEPTKKQGVQDIEPPKHGERPKDSSAEERWKSKSADERRILLDRFEQLRRLSPEDREALRKRAGELADQRRELESGLEPGVRRNLDDLPPHERSRILREHQVAERRRAGEALRESLDEGPREMVEDLVGQRGGPPRPFHEKRDELRGALSDKVVKHFGELGHLTPEEQQHLLKLPEPERIHEALLIKRTRIKEAVVKLGLPEGVSDKQWKKMLEEPSVERFLKYARKRGFDEHLGLGRFDIPQTGGRKGPGGPDSERAPRGGPDLEREPPRGPDGFPGRGQKGGPGPGGNEGAGRDQEGPNRHEPEAGSDAKGFRDLADVLRPTLEDRMATSELPDADRRKAMSKRLKQRAAAFLKNHAILTEQERAILKELKADDYVKFLAELVHERRGLGPRGPKESGKRDQPGRGPKERGPRR